MKNDVINSKGITLEAYRTWEQLTDEEQSQVIFVDGTNQKDYATYQVRRNKHNEIISVQAYELTVDKTSANEKAFKEYNIIDAMNILFGNGKERARSIKKLEKKNGRRFTTTKKQITSAMEVLD